MSEAQELAQIIKYDHSVLSHEGQKFGGFHTVSRSIASKSRLTTEYEVMTISPSGRELEWSYSETLPHKVKNNVASIS